MNNQVNGSLVDLKLVEKSLDELRDLHNEMVLTAVDFALAAEPVEAFASVNEGVAACERLHVQIEKARERAAAPPKKERRKAAAKQKATYTRVADPYAVVAGFTETKEKTVAKKAKKAKSKKVAAKKANGGAPRAGKYPLDAKITWVAKENPGRKGSIFFDRMEKVRKASGKTVEAAVKGGVPTGDIRLAVDKEAAKVSGGTARA